MLAIAEDGVTLGQVDLFHVAAFLEFFFAAETDQLDNFALGTKIFDLFIFFVKICQSFLIADVFVVLIK